MKGPPPPTTAPRRRPRALPTLLLGLSVALAGCASRLPATNAAAEVAVPTRWSEGGADQAQSPTSLVSWWQRFGDAQLSALIEDGLRHSPTVHAAVAALRQSRALADVARAGYSPNVTGSSSAQRSRTASAGTTNTFAVGLNASWEPDLFGATRAGVSAAEADARAAQMSLGNVQISLAAEIALAYIDLRDQQARLTIAERNLASQDDTLQITRWRQQAGLVSALDVEQAATSAEQTRAQVPVRQAARDQARHRLALLTGRAPGTLAALGNAPVPLPPDDLVMAFPADTLRQRPDVQQTEAQVRAAWARLVQADAARYPTFSLSGSLGLQALTLGGLTAGGALVRTLAAGLSLPIFDGGAINATVRAQQAAYEQARANHQSSVLTALQDVEDALVALQGDRARIGSLQAAASAAERADALARQQYQAGLIDFATVLTSQRTLLSAQDSAASVRASLANDHVALYKALGGGWAPTSADSDPATDASANANAGTVPGADAAPEPTAAIVATPISNAAAR
ncbi:efflux transporter outer membrane subunit [Ottowia beijingensis]|uniref:efflux transporter outer membrane subunit n=1 Tax=Ottowia beijingensis TaxID=1207057 RepID=UPI003631EDA3